MGKNDEIELLTMDDEETVEIEDPVSKIIQDKIDTDKKELVERNKLSNEYKIILGYSILAVILLVLMIVRKM